MGYFYYYSGGDFIRGETTAMEFIGTGPLHM